MIGLNINTVIEERKDTAIRNICPSVTTIYHKNPWPWRCLDEEGNTVEYDITLVEAEITRLETEYDAQEYARKREVEYPEIKDQLDYIFHNGVEKWKIDIVQPVKDKYPKS